MYIYIYIERERETYIVYLSIYIYIYRERERGRERHCYFCLRASGLRMPRLQRRNGKILLGGMTYLSNATCLIRPRSFYALAYSVKDHHNMLHCSTRLKNTCVRQEVLDKWFPLILVVAGGHANDINVLCCCVVQYIILQHTIISYCIALYHSISSILIVTLIYIYIYIHVYTNMCVYIYIYIYIHGPRRRPACRASGRRRPWSPGRRATDCGPTHKHINK